MEETILEGIGYAIPALVTGAVAYFVMSGLRNQETNEKKLDLLAQKKRESLPIRLQAYERMLVFCERINPVKMLVRIKPIGDSSEAYLQLLLASIEQEFQHNMVQQLYITDECWNVVIASKAAVINKLKLVSTSSTLANEFREQILLEYAKKAPQTDPPAHCKPVDKVRPYRPKRTARIKLPPLRVPSHPQESTTGPDKTPAPARRY